MRDCAFTGDERLEGGLDTVERTARPIRQGSNPLKERSRAVASVTVALLAVVLASTPAVSGASNRPAAPKATTARPVGTISHLGRWLTDADGRVVLLHGVNMVEKEAPYYPSADGFGPADARWLTANGLDVVRLGVLATGLMPTPGHIDQSYLFHLAATVQTLGRHHIYVLLDLHQDGYGPTVGSDGFPGWMTLTHGAANTHATFPTYYLSDPAIQAAFVSLWRNDKGPDGVGLGTDVARMFGAIAKRFGHTPNVIGYDVFNEPWPGTTWMPCLTHGCPALVRSELDPLYQKVDRAIRAYDLHHMVFVEPFVLFNFGTAGTSVARPNGDPASGLAFHQYATSTSAEASVLKNAVQWSTRTHGALFDTEWGATQTSATIEAQASQFDQSLVPWIFWSFDGEIVTHLTQPPTGSNLVGSTADAVVRPYPLAVGGTPDSAIAYSPVTHRFSAAWTSTEPDGRQAPAGTVSSFEVPARDYPSGYTATVSGGRVTSPPCAPLLTVASSPGRRQLSVVVSAGGRCPSPAR